jgi:hypothetical protein
MPRLARRIPFVSCALLAVSACSPQPTAREPDAVRSDVWRNGAAEHSCPEGIALREEFWPARGSVRGSSARWCELSDGTRQGPYAAWWDNGARQAQGLYVNGEKHGTWLNWDHTERLYQTEEWWHGEPVTVNGEPVEAGELFGSE